MPTVMVVDDRTGIRKLLQEVLQGGDRATLAVLVGTVGHPALLSFGVDDAGGYTPRERGCKRRPRSAQVEQERDGTHGNWTRNSKVGKPVRKTRSDLQPPKKLSGT